MNVTGHDDQSLKSFAAVIITEILRLLGVDAHLAEFTLAFTSTPVISWDELGELERQIRTVNDQYELYDISLADQPEPGGSSFTFKVLVTIRPPS